MLTAHPLTPPASLPAVARSFREAIDRCADREALHALLAGACRELGFDHFALLHHAAPRSGSPARLRLDNYPGAWVDRMKARTLCRVDPVHAACLATNVGFSWDSIPGSALAADQRRAFEEAGRHGLRVGFTVPIHLPGQPAASCSFAARSTISLGHERTMAAECIAAHGFRAAHRLLGPAPAARPRLSRRELQCVALVAAGKSDWEIGRILGISEETVRTYVKSARAAYDVTTRTQLAVQALRDGTIGFE